MDDSTTASGLIASVEKTRIDFLHADLALCFTFVDLSETELGLDDREAAARVLGKAEDGYATISKFVIGVRDPIQWEQIELKLKKLRDRIDEMRQALLF